MKINKKTIIIGSSISILFISSIVNADSLINSTKGKILLQVEGSGEAWYVNPKTETRSYMGLPKDAFETMRAQGVGISNTDIAKIPIGEKNINNGKDSDGDGLADSFEDAVGTDKTKKDSDNDGKDDKTELLTGYNPNSSNSTSLIDKIFAEKQSGKILLQVEQNGEAWYVYPSDNKRYFLSRPEDAFSIMRSLGLGISNENLNKIKKSGSEEKATTQTNQTKTTTQTNTKNNEKKPLNNVCESLSEGATCQFTGPNNETVSGTCSKGRDDELMCHSDNEKSMPKDNNFEEMKKICESLSEGTTCQFTGPNNETVSGTCEIGKDNNLMCRPANMPKNNN